MTFWHFVAQNRYEIADLTLERPRWRGAASAVLAGRGLHAVWSGGLEPGAAAGGGGGMGELMSRAVAMVKIGATLAGWGAAPRWALGEGRSLGGWEKRLSSQRAA